MVASAPSRSMTSELKVATVKRLVTPKVTNVAYDDGILIIPTLSSVIDADSPNWGASRATLVSRP